MALRSLWQQQFTQTVDDLLIIERFAEIGVTTNAHRFYTRNGFTLDGATHTEPFLGETLTEVRFVR